MGADFNIDVGFRTVAFEKSVGASGKGVDSGTGSGDDEEKKMSPFRKALVAGLTAVGFVAFLKNIKIVVDTLGAILGLINLGVIVFLKAMYDFFKDPLRGLLNFALFLGNLFISAFEKFANFLKPGKDVDFGRFRADVVGEELDAGTGLIKALNEGFLTEEEYQKRKIAKALIATQKQEQAYEEELKAQDARLKFNRTITEEYDSRLDPALFDATSSIFNFFVNLRKESDRLNKLFGRNAAAGVRFAQARQETPLTESQFLGASRLQSTTIKEQDARAFNYLVGLNR